MNFSGKEGHPNIQPSTRPGIEPGTSGLGGRDLNYCANSSAELVIEGVGAVVKRSVQVTQTESSSQSGP